MHAEQKLLLQAVQESVPSKSHGICDLLQNPAELYAYRGRPVFYNRDRIRVRLYEQQLFYGNVPESDRHDTDTV